MSSSITAAAAATRSGGGYPKIEADTVATDVNLTGTVHLASVVER